jgi:SAM-dependent methyltransferase
MTSIADSAAVFEPERMLTQHQAALTLLQQMVSDPAKERVQWLDLGCGKGQVVAHLDKNLSLRSRSKLRYFGYDIDNGFARNADMTASKMGLADCEFAIGDLAEFHKHDKLAGPWDFITFTNAVHELRPHSLARILLEAIVRLDESGCLFIYDMETLASPELGAVLWTGSEFGELLGSVFHALGCSEYEPTVGSWVHKSCAGWNAQIHRKHLKLPSNVIDSLESAVDKTVDSIAGLLGRKLKNTKDALEGLTRYGPQNAAEEADKPRLLNDLWALTRALEKAK